MAVTGSDITAAPRLAKARTMSRSLTIPPTEVPSLDTTTAPIPCSASTSSRRRTFVSGGTVTTCVPLPRSTSVIRIWPPGAVTGPDGVPAGPGNYYWRLVLRAGGCGRGRAVVGCRLGATSFPEGRQMKVSLFEQVPYRYMPEGFENQHNSVVTAPYQVVEPERMTETRPCPRSRPASATASTAS